MTTNTKYLRDSNDPVLHAYADMIEKNDAIWECMKQIMEAKIDLSEAKLQTWRMSHTAEPMSVFTTQVEITLITPYIPGRSKSCGFHGSTKP